MAEVRADLTLDLSEALSSVDELAAAVESSVQAVPVTADTTEAFASIEDFAAVADAMGPMVPVDADVAAAQAELESFAALAEATDYVIPVDADVSQAEDAVAGLGDAIDSAGGSAGAAQSQVDGFGSAAGIAGGAAALARGNVEGASGAFGKLAQNVPVAGAALAAGAVALGTIFAVGEKSQAAIERLDLVLGDSKDAIENLDVGGLTGSLSDLAIQGGSSAAGIRQAAAAIAQMGISSGATKPQAALVASQVEALSLRATAMNPKLGEAGDVMGRLGLALARGGRFAAQFGLGMLTASDITDRASQMTGKAASELTVYEKSAAGAQLAVEALGGHIGKDFTEGSQQSAVQFKALEKQFQSLLATLGRPLVQPFLELAKATVPIAEVVAGMAELAITVSGIEPVLTALADGVDALSPVFKALGDGMKVISDNDELAILFGAVAAAALVAAVGVDVFVGAMASAAEAVVAATVAMATNPFVLVGLGIAAVVAALGVFGGAEDSATDATKAYSDALNQNSGALDANAEKALKNTLQQQGVLKAANAAGISYDQLKAATTGLDEAHGKLAAKLGAVGTGFITQISLSDTSSKGYKDVQAAADAVSPSMGEVVRQLAAQGQLTPQVVATLAGLAQASGKATGAQSDLERSGAAVVLTTKKQEEAYSAAGQAAKEYKDALDVLNGVQITVTGAQTDMAKSVADLDSAWADAGGALDLGSKAALANRDALQGAVSSAQSMATALYQSGKSAQESAYPLQLLAGHIATLSGASDANAASIAQTLVQFGLLSTGAASSVTNLDTLNAAIAGIGPGAQAATNTAATAVNELPPKIAAAVAAGATLVRNMDGTYSAVGLSTGKALADGAKQGADETPKHVGKATADAAAAGTRGTGAMATAGRALGQGFANGLLEMQGTANAAGGALASSAAAGTRGTGGMAEAGNALANAFANAIRNGQDTAYAAGQSLARSAAAGARNAGSPSEHLFFDAGSDMTMAFSEGLVAVAAVARGAAQQVVRTAVPSSASTPGAAGNVLAHRLDQANQAGITVHVEGVTDPYAAAVLVGRELSYQRQLTGV